MQAINLRNVALAALAAACASFGAGCYADAQPVPVAVAYEYQPQVVQPAPVAAYADPSQAPQPPQAAQYAQYAQPEPVAAYGYQPQYYNGSLVYYDNEGRPYFYDSSGGVAWVPAASPEYAGYVGHWRAYGPAYRRWYSGYGHRYHGYHRYWRHWH